MRFIDEYLPPCIPGYPCVSAPVFGNVISRVASGAENVRQIWESPLHNYSLPVAARQHEIVEALRHMWMVTAGNARTWPFRDPMDFASCDLTAPNTVPQISMLDQDIGVGDGLNAVFQLVKTYTFGMETFTRTIHLPILDTLMIAANGILVNPTDYSVTRPGGVITFDTPPAAAAVLTAGYLYDVEVRFADNDTFASVVRASTVSGFENINLVEVRPCGFSSS